MASNKIHLGNTKIVSAAGAPEGIVIASPTKSGTMALLSDVGGGASPVDTYTKTEIDDQQDAQDADIVINNDEIARQQIEITNNTANITKNDTAINKNILDIATNTGNIASNTAQIATNTADIAAMGDGGGVPTDTYTKAQIDEQQGIQDSNISSNTTAIGTLSGQVGQNSEDIAELQDSIFFSSAYSADYPSSPNRDPENGNMYLQNFAMFTYSYASATQIFCSKTDESGNVRQFTAIQPGDSIVLNEVDSPNYGRYELVSIEEVSESYVVMNVIPKLGEGTIVAGVKVAFQGFPKPDSGTGDGIPEAPIDGKQYGRQDAEWTEVTGGGGDAQPPVAMSYTINSDIVITDEATADYPVVFDKKEFDSINALNTSTGRFTPTQSGVYQVSYSVLASPCAQRTLTKIFKNDVEVGIGTQTFNGEVQAQNTSLCSILIEMNGVDDYLDFKVLRTGGTGSIVLTAFAGTYLNIHMISSITEGEVKEKEAVVFRSQLSATQSIASDAWVKVNFDSVSGADLFDTSSSFDTTLNRFKPTTEGYYQVNSVIRITGVASLAQIQLRKNGADYEGGNLLGAPTGGDQYKLSTIVYLDGKDDYVEMFGYARGSELTFQKLDGEKANNCYFSASLITGQSSGGTGGGAPSVDTAIGMVAPFAMDSVPTGWLHCDGSAVSRTTYSSLYSKVADLYGAGDGSTTFNLPDLQDEFVRGSSDTLAVGTKQDDEFKAHSHAYAKFPGPAGNAIMYGNGAVQQTLETGDTGGEETRPRNVAMLYCINATAEPSSGGGEVQEANVTSFSLTNPQTVPNDTETKVIFDTKKYDDNNNYDTGTGIFKPKIAGYYQLNASVRMQQNAVNRVVVKFEKNNGTSFGFTNLYANEGTSSVNSNDTEYFDGVNDSAYISVYQDSGSSQDLYTLGGDTSNYFDAHLITGQSSGGTGGSGTTDILPVLITGKVLPDGTIEDGSGFTCVNTAVGQYDITFDTPRASMDYIVNSTTVTSSARYATVGSYTENGFTVWVRTETGAEESTVPFNQGFTFTVTGTETIAVGGGSGSGGKTVAFRGNLSADQTGLTTVTWTKINLNTTSIDTDNALVDGKFKPSVAGYYQVNGGVRERCSPVSTQTVAAIYKNGLLVTIGNYGLMDESTNGSVNDIFYLDGKDDYLELFGQVKSSGTCGIESASKDTFLSAVLVSGGSGDSIWTEENDTASHDGVVKLTRNSNTMYINPDLSDAGESSTIESQTLPLTFTVGSNEAMTINTDGGVLIPDMDTTVQPPNVYIDGKGQLYQSTTVFYSAEEVDKKLAIKDKLIEKLSARLDELEKRLKK